MARAERTGIKAVFLDRDGTVNEEKGYVHRIEDFELIPGALEALQLLTKKGIKIYLFTNQAGIAKGLYTELDFHDFASEVIWRLGSQGVVIEDVLYCPHHPEGTVPRYRMDCQCRKPGTALVEEVMTSLGLSSDEAVLVGDKNSDIEAGRRIGMKTYLVLTGYGASHQAATKATHIMRDLAAVVGHITGGSERSDRVDVIVLAGGLGTRLRSAVPDTQKVIASVGGTPFLDILLGTLDRYEFIGRVVIAAGYMADKVFEHYEKGHRHRFDIVFSEEKELLGTGGAIKKALKYTQTDTVLVMNGDSFVEADLNDLRANLEMRAAHMTMVLKKVDDVSRFGRVALGDDMRITRFDEKGLGALPGVINAGVYLFRRTLFDDVEDGVNLSLERDLLPAFLEKPVYGFESMGRFIDIGTPETYRAAESYLKGVRNG